MNSVCVTPRGRASRRISSRLRRSSVCESSDCREIVRVRKTPPPCATSIGGLPYLLTAVKTVSASGGSEKGRVVKEWSSDVCSSDLVVRLPGDRAREKDAAAVRDLHRRLAVLAHGGEDRLGLGGIGKGSCSERVEFRRVLFRSSRPAAGRSCA